MSKHCDYLNDGCADELKIYSVDKVTENMIRKYINDLQERGKYK